MKDKLAYMDGDFKKRLSFRWKYILEMMMVVMLAAVLCLQLYMVFRDNQTTCHCEPKHGSTAQQSQLGNTECTTMQPGKDSTTEQSGHETTSKPITNSTTVQSGHETTSKPDTNSTTEQSSRESTTEQPGVTTTSTERPTTERTTQHECADDEMCFDLDSTGEITGALSGVSIRSAITGSQGYDCSRQGVIDVQFEKLPDNSSGLCHNGSYTGQRMLKIQMYFARDKSGWTFDIGDSPTNNGWACDAGTTDYAAEFNGKDNSLLFYANAIDRPTTCAAQLLYQYEFSSNVRNVNTWIANNYFKMNSDTGICDEHCDKCLYGLNDQPVRGSINRDIHIGVNRVIYGSSRTGHGLCYIKLKWVDHSVQ